MRKLLLVLAACACPSKPTAVPQTGSGAVAPTGACADARANVEQLYRAEAQQKEPKRVDEATADNTRMVMTDCAKDPARVAPCLQKAASVAELEKQCLIPLDEEGTEGER
jgi:hypothetical protein